MMLDKLFGNQTAASALLFLARYEEAAISEMAKAFHVSKTQLYQQLTKLEDAGILSSREIGNLRIYFFNPRSPIKNELRALLEKYIDTNMPKESNPDFYLIRKRPRSRGKKLGGAYERSK
ncbi:winged helix-turn-helix domain-containing protein [Bdellovibrio bacteriovorus]|nr:winged helix-turn-helix domain-containing protein [Bdellovibrio bacteriovorus]